MKKSRSVRRNRSKKFRRAKRRYRTSKSSRRHYKRRKTRRDRSTRTRRFKKIQKGGSGLGSALYNAAFVGSGPPLGTDPKSKAAQDCARDRS